MLDNSASGRKLLGGLFRLVSVILFYVYLGPDWVEDVQDAIVSFLSDDPDSAGANLVAKLFAAVIALWAIYWFGLGIYKIYTFNMYLDVFESKLTPFQKRHMKDGNSREPSSRDFEGHHRVKNLDSGKLSGRDYEGHNRVTEYYKRK
jgi:hypothetical protein